MIITDHQEHISLIVGTYLTQTVIAHAVNTFPTPSNKYWSWFLGLIQFAVGQRTIAKNTLQGLQTDAVGVQTLTK